MSSSSDSESSYDTDQSSDHEDKERGSNSKNNKRKNKNDGDNNDNKKKKSKNVVPTPPPLELAPPVVDPNKSNVKKNKQPIIVLLDQATLEIIKNRHNNYELLNCDDHRDICKKKLKKDPNFYRPDILHQELLALLDSPLNKAGYLKVYIQTCKRVLIDINSSIRIPRTYKRFAGLMVQLLHKLKIKASSNSGGGNTTLLKVIKNPFSQYLPPGTRCYGFSCQGTLYNPYNLAKALLPQDIPDFENDDNPSPPICFVIGAMSTGHVTIDDHPYIEKMLSISNYPLSGASAISRIMTGIEHYWGIV